MQTGDQRSAMAAERGRAGMNVWLIPAGAFVLIVTLAWLLRSSIDSLLLSTAVHDCDTMVLAWFRSSATPALDRVVQSVTLLGSPFAMAMYAFVGLTMLLNRRKWLLLFTWDVMFLGMLGLTTAIKPLFHRTRPAGSEQFLNAISFGFPSTHALSAVAAFGMITFALTETVQMDREPRAVLWLFTVVLMLVIATSRLYLGVHYFSDVVAGILLGAVWLAVCIFAYRRARTRYDLASLPGTTNL